MSTQIIEIDSFFPVKVELIPQGIELPCDIFILKNNDYEILSKKGEKFTLETLQNLKDKKVDSLYINNQDKKIFCNFICEYKPKECFDNLLDRYTVCNQIYYKVEKECLDSEIQINFSLYINDGKKFNIYIEASEENPKNINIERIPEGDLLISKRDLNKYFEYLKILMKIRKNEPLILKETTKLILREVYSEPTNKQNLLVLIDKINEIVEFASVEAKALESLFILKKLENYSYIHSFNVLSLSIAMGLKIKLNREELKHLATAAALHDIGKIKISPLILSKIGKMNEKEFQIYKTHVRESIELAKTLGLDEKVLLGIAHHHEKLNGNGYPFGLRGSKISLFGQIIGICDAYDLLTTPKPMKYPLTPFNALMILVQDKDCYEKKLLEIFIKMLGKLI